jgi:hypothetical protein
MCPFYNTSWPNTGCAFLLPTSVEQRSIKLTGMGALKREKMRATVHYIYQCLIHPKTHMTTLAAMPHSFYFRTLTDIH